MQSKRGRVSGIAALSITAAATLMGVLPATASADEGRAPTTNPCVVLNQLAANPEFVKFVNNNSVNPGFLKVVSSATFQKLLTTCGPAVPPIFNFLKIIT